MALGGIELSKITDHCKQLPAYRDALPIISMLQGIAMGEDDAKEIAEAIDEIRSHFRTKQPAPNNEQKKLPPGVATPELPELKFFKKVNVGWIPIFKNILRGCIEQIDLTGKKEWFCIYIAWRYLTRTDGDGKPGYAPFFVDIDALFPGLLKDVRTDLPGNRRFKPYTDMLSDEYKNWAVDKGHMPPMQYWAHSDWTSKYLSNKKERIERMQQLVRTFYTAFAQLLKDQKLKF